MTMLEILYLILGGFVILAVVFVYYILTLRRTIKENLITIEEQIERIEAKETKSYNLGMSSLRGQWLELLGDFESIRHYDQLAVLSSATKQFSLDLLGIVEKDDENKGNARIDFIEFKSGKFSSDTTKHRKNDWDLSKKEKIVKKLVDEKKVNYVIKEIDLPEWFEAKERE